MIVPSLDDMNICATILESAQLNTMFFVCLPTWHQANSHGPLDNLHNFNRSVHMMGLGIVSILNDDSNALLCM